MKQLSFMPLGHIVSCVADETGVTVDDIRGPSRFKPVMRPRLITYWLARTWTDKSYTQIARALQRGDHTTVISGFRRANHLMKSDPKFASDVAKCAVRITGQHQTRDAGANILLDFRH